jgi:hypothetical protein
MFCGNDKTSKRTENFALDSLPKHERLSFVVDQVQVARWRREREKFSVIDRGICQLTFLQWKNQQIIGTFVSPRDFDSICLQLHVPSIRGNWRGLNRPLLSPFRQRRRIKTVSRTGDKSTTVAKYGKGRSTDN